MPWFKVDDGLHAHKKAVRAGVPAMGLWVLAGTWCADQLTDGWVPDYIAARLDPDYEEHAAALVRAGLWEPGERSEDVRANGSEHVRANDTERGWWFHEWGEHQPSSESVLAKRDEAKERMKRIREARRTANSAGQNGSEQSEYVRANTSRTSREVRSTPTRPDPTHKELPSEVLEAAPKRPKRGTRIPDDFSITPEMATWGKEHAPNVHGVRETERFVDYWRGVAGAKGVKTDWVATWRNWMRKAQDDGQPSNVIAMPGRTNGTRASLPPSNAPVAIPADERCPDHRGEIKGKCRHCRALAIGRPQEIS